MWLFPHWTSRTEATGRERQVRSMICADVCAIVPPLLLLNIASGRVDTLQSLQRSAVIPSRGAARVFIRASIAIRSFAHMDPHLRAARCDLLQPGQTITYSDGATSDDGRRRIPSNRTRGLVPIGKPSGHGITVQPEIVISQVMTLLPSPATSEQAAHKQPRILVPRRPSRSRVPCRSAAELARR